MYSHFRLALVCLANHSKYGTFRLYVSPLAKIGDTKKAQDYKNAAIGTQMKIETHRIDGLMLGDGIACSDITYFRYDKNSTSDMALEYGFLHWKTKSDLKLQTLIEQHPLLHR